MDSEKKRIFIALLLSDEFKNQVTEAILPMKNKFPDCRWLPENKWHLTVLPPHYWNEKETKKVVESLERRLSCEKISLRATKITLGPLGHDKRMVWLEFEKSKEFSDLKRQVSKILTVMDLSLDDSRQKELIHLTLARFKDLDYSDIKERSFDLGVLCSGIEAWQVFLNPGGAIYQTIARFELK